MVVRSGSLYSINLSVQNNLTMVGQLPYINMSGGVSIVIEDFAVFNMPNGGIINASSGTLAVSSQGLFMCTTSAVCHLSTPWTNHGSAVVKGTGKLVLSQSSTTTGVLAVIEGGSVVIAGGSTHYFNEQSILNITGELTDKSSSSTTTNVASRSLFIGGIQKTGESKLYIVPQDHPISYVYVTNGLLKFTNRNTSAVTQINILNVLGGEVEIAANAIVNDMNTKSCTLTINEQVTVSNGWLWDGGIVRGSGSLAVYGKLELDDTVAIHHRLDLYVKDFTLHGTFSPKFTSLLKMSNSKITVASDGVMTLNVDSFFVQGFSNTIFDNWGQIIVLGGWTTMFPRLFNNYGVVIVGGQNESAYFLVHAGGTIKGKYVVEEGSTLDFASRLKIEEEMDGLITGEGTLRAGGTKVIVRNIDISYIAVGSTTFSLQPNPSQDDQFRINSLKVVGGNCILDAFTDKFYITTLEVSGGFLDVLAPTTCDDMTVRGTVNIYADMTVHNTLFMTRGGTIKGNDFNMINASTLRLGESQFYFYSLIVRVWLRLVVRSHQTTLRLMSGSHLNLESTTSSDVDGSSLTFETDGESGVIENYGLISILGAKVAVNVGLNNFGTIYLDNSEMTINQLATCSGSIAIALNSTMTLSNTLVMTPDGVLQGNGEMKVTGGTSLLSGVSVQTLTVSGGTAVLNLGSQLVKDIQVAGGTLEMKTSYSQSQNARVPRRVDRISVVSGTVESHDTILINELLVRGGTFRLNADSYVSGIMHWTGGNIEGQNYSQVSRM